VSCFGSSAALLRQHDSATYEVNGRQFVVIAAGGGQRSQVAFRGVYVAFGLPQESSTPSASSERSNNFGIVEKLLFVQEPAQQIGELLTPAAERSLDAPQRRRFLPAVRLRRQVATAASSGTYLRSVGQRLPSDFVRRSSSELFHCVASNPSRRPEEDAGCNFQVRPAVVALISTFSTSNRSKITSGSCNFMGHVAQDASRRRCLIRKCHRRSRRASAVCFLCQ